MLRPGDPSTNSSKMSLQDQIHDLSLYTKKEKRRTNDDFLNFVNIVLTYTKYEEIRNSESYPKQEQDDRKSIESPLNVNDSLVFNGSSSRTCKWLDGIESCSSSSSSSFGDQEQELNETGGEADKNDESYSMVTCWCGKPFAGRPMIECESCLIWIHLSCARVRKTNIPKHFKCSRCKPRTPRRKRTASGNLEEYEQASPSELLTNGNFEGLSETSSTLASPGLLHDSTSPSSSSSTQQQHQNSNNIKLPRYPNKFSQDKMRKKKPKGIPKSPKKISTNVGMNSRPKATSRKSYQNLSDIGENLSLPLKLTFATGPIGESS